MRRKAPGRLGKIPRPILTPDENTVRFSFRLLDYSNPKFLPTDCPCDFWPALMNRLKGYSDLTVDIFLDQNNPERRHRIIFEETTEVGFSNVDPEQLGFEEAWQFDLASSKEWRIAGLFIDDVFYVIWLDHGHRLYLRGRGRAET